jgi:hypothetical protein
MLVCESMDACISVCTVAKSSIHRSSHLIPSVEFCPTNSLEDEGKLFIHSNPLEQVSIIYTSVIKLSLEERLILLHLLDATDGNVVVVCGHRNVSCGEGTKDEDPVESYDPSPEREQEPRLDGLDENARFTAPINFFILHSTGNNNTR